MRTQGGTSWAEGTQERKASAPEAGTSMLHLMQGGEGPQGCSLKSAQRVPRVTVRRGLLTKDLVNQDKGQILF